MIASERASSLQRRAGSARLAMLTAALVSCAPAPKPIAQPRPRPHEIGDAGANGTRIDDDVASLDELARRGPADAPLMRETLRVADAAKPTEIKVSSGDACFRAIIAAKSPVRAWFEDESRTPRGEIASSAGLVPPRGPACARKGETLRLVVEPATAMSVARAVVWQAP